jgi:anti-sigma regulatory factor (Ser/Thr protein kinase)
MLAVNELAANAVRHGGGTGRLRISALPGVLRRQVDDGGSASRKAQASSASQGNPDRMNDGTPSWPYQAGHGLWLVRAIADMMDIQTGSGGSRVAVTFTLPH